MDIQVLGQERMSQTGSSLISLMQDKSIRKLDLLVREAVQNSLDASLDRSKNTRVEVDFVTGSFESRRFSSEFEYIESRLNARYPGEYYQFIAVRDSGTFGLTGTNDISDDWSRLQGLVYHISKRQSMEGSGGYWGLGKTTFFKIGIGLVVYYSRTKENGTYKSKLAAALVENENENPLVSIEDSRGISFFGRYESGSEKNIRNITVPVDDEEYIENFLSIFGMKPYSGETTGTTVIMPYVNFGALLRETEPTGIEGISGRNPTWISSVEEYLNVAIQRWYCPRLSNPDYDGSWLKASINGKPIARDSMFPLFRLISEMYNASSDDSYSSDFLKDFDVKTSQILCNAVKGKVAGYIGAVYTSAESLKLTDEYFRNAYALIGEYDAALSSPIVTYTRKPGMLVRYVTRNSPWIPNIQNPDEEKILVCVFKLASDGVLRDGETKLEEYMRARERADHNNWENETKLGIVEKIAGGTASKLKKLFSTTVKNDLRKRSALSKLFADMFLPVTTGSPNAVTDSGTGRKTGTRVRKRSRGTKSRFEILSSSFDGFSRVMEFELSMGAASDEVDLELVVSSERGSINHSEWENDMGREFPLRIKELTVKKTVMKSGKPKERIDTVDTADTVTAFENYTVFVKKSRMGKVYGVTVKGEPGMSLTGTVTVECTHKSVSFEIKNQSRRSD
jgi:hypothetical protein